MQRSEHHKVNGEQNHHSDNLTDATTEGIKSGGFVAKLSNSHFAHTALKVLKPLEKAVKAVTFAKDYNTNRDEGHSHIASAGGALAGFAARVVVQAAATLEATAAVELAATGVGLPVSGTVAAGSYYTFKKSNSVGQTTSRVVAGTIDALPEADVHYSTFGLGESDVFVPKKQKGEESKMFSHIQNKLNEVKVQHVKQANLQGEVEFEERDRKMKEAEVYQKERREADSRAASRRKALGIVLPEPTISSTQHIRSATETKAVTKTTLANPPSEDKTQINSTILPEDKQIAEFLVAYGATPEGVVKIFQDPAAWDIAKHSVAQFREQEIKFAQQQDKTTCLAFFNGAGNIFQALSDGSSPELRVVGRVGLPIMSALGHVESLWGVFSGSAGSLSTTGFWGSFGAIGGLVGAGIGLLNVLLGDDGEQQRQLMEAFNLIHDHLNGFERRVHERFDHLDVAVELVDRRVQQVAFACQQIINNQKTIFELNKHVLQGLHTVQTMLHDLHAENRADHRKTFEEINYSVRLKSIKDLLGFRETIEAHVDSIKESMRMTPKTSEDVRAIKFRIYDQLGKLKEDIKKACSPVRNGCAEFEADGNALQYKNYLLMCKKFNYHPLGFLAKVYESLTRSSLEEKGIYIEKLPVTNLWLNAVRAYVVFRASPWLDCSEGSTTFTFIDEHITNAQNLLNQIKQSNIISLLMTRYEQALDEFQRTLFYSYSKIRREKQESKEALYSGSKKLTFKEFFTTGASYKALEEMGHQVDYYRLLLLQFSSIVGSSQEEQHQISRLTSSKELFERTFTFNELPEVAGGFFYESSAIAGHGWGRLWYNNEFLEPIGTCHYQEGEKSSLVIQYGYPTAPYRPSVTVKTSLEHYDITAHKHNRISQPEWPLAQEYKTDISQFANHAWMQTHLIKLPTDNTLYHVVFLPEHGVLMRNVTTGNWITCDNRGYEYAKFNVPLWNGTSTSSFKGFNRRSNSVPTQKRPYAAAYTFINQNRFLIVSETKWQGNTRETTIDLGGGFTLPDVEFVPLDSATSPSSMQNNLYTFDLQHQRWLDWNGNRNLLDLGWTHDYVGYNPTEITSPNQLFNVQCVPLNPSKVSTIIQGTLVATQTELKLSLDCKIIKNTALKREEKESRWLSHYMFDSYPASGFKKYFSGKYEASFPLEVKTIHQTKAEVVNDQLAVVCSVVEGDKKNLIVLSSDLYDFDFKKADEFDIPFANDVSDWQAMRVKKTPLLGGTEYLIISLFDSEYRLRIFCYDPGTKKINYLFTGPQVEFLSYVRDPKVRGYREPCYDEKLIDARKKYPGFYPVVGIDLNISMRCSDAKDKNDKMCILHISYTQSAGSGAAMRKVVTNQYNLTPILTPADKPNRQLRSLSSPVLPSGEVRSISPASATSPVKSFISAQLEAARTLIGAQGIQNVASRLLASSTAPESKTPTRDTGSEPASSFMRSLSPHRANSMFSENSMPLTQQSNSTVLMAPPPDLDEEDIQAEANKHVATRMPGK